MVVAATVRAHSLRTSSVVLRVLLLSMAMTTSTSSMFVISVILGSFLLDSGQLFETAAKVVHVLSLQPLLFLLSKALCHSFFLKLFVVFIS